MRPYPVEVGGVLAEYAREVALPEDQEVVEALAPHAAKEPLADGIRLRRAIGRAQDLDAARRRYLRRRAPPAAWLSTVTQPLRVWIDQILIAILDSILQSSSECT